MGLLTERQVRKSPAGTGNDEAASRSSYLTIFCEIVTRLRPSLFAR